MESWGEREHRRLLDRVRRAVRTSRLWGPGDRLLVASSGGLDSTVALSLLHALEPSLGHSLVAGHVDHGLRDGGALDAQAVRARAAALGLPFEGRRLDLVPGAGLQGRAREARYRALHEMARAAGCARVVTAHHADDQAETLLMRLSRGCGVQGLAGIRAARPDAVVRPLLGVRRAELLACARHLGLSWREDPSNAELHHRRNRLRHAVLPALDEAIPGASVGFARTAANMGGQAEATAFFVRAWVEAFVRLEAGEAVAVVARGALPAGVTALGLLLGELARRWRMPPPDRRGVTQLRAWLDKTPAATGPCELRGMRARLCRDDVRIEATNIAPPPGADYPGPWGC